jgi:hypothetical protein
VKIYPPEGYRKWWLGVAALILSGVFVLFGLLTGEQWNYALGLILGITGGGNVAEHFAARPHNPNPPDPGVEVKADDDATITTTVHE